MTPITPVLWLLLALFALRVLAQLVQRLSPVAWLPPFEIWHGAVLAYWQLLAVQVALLVWLARIALRHTRGTVKPRAAVGRAMLVLGSCYAAAVVVRFAVGRFGLSDSEWFERPIPTFFHAVLAGWVLCVGEFHRRGTRSKTPITMRS